MTKLIEISNGSLASVDDEDYEALMMYDWTHMHGYAYRKEFQQNIFMHRSILGYTGPLDIDHINRNKLDNRKENLRIVPSSINHLNNDCDNVVTVYQVSGRVSYKAYACYRFKRYHLGVFSTYERALAFSRRAKQDIINGEQYIHAYKSKHSSLPKERILIYVGESHE